MAERERDNLSREELERARSAPRRRGLLRRVLLLLLVLVAVLGAVAFAAFRDLNGVDSLRRLLNYNKVSADAEGKAELYHFDSDRTNRFAMLGDSLLVVSTTRVALTDDEGAELFSQSVSLANPAIASGAQTAAVYDIGGDTLLLLGRRGLVRDMSGESGSGILSASLNASDYLAVTTKKSGYKSAVTVYDASGEPVFTFNSSDRYVSDAIVLNDCRHLAAVTLGEADGAFASVLTLYALDSETPVASTTLTGSLALSLGNLSGTLAALQDDRLTTFRADGTLSGSYRYEYPHLRDGDFGGADYAAVLLSRYRSGSAYRLVTVGGSGEILGTLDARREVLDISAAGKYVAVLYGDSLTIYTSDLAEYAALSGTDYAKRVVMRSDGTALLIGAASAWLFIP